MQPLAADLRRLFQDALVGRVPGQGRAGPGLARALHRGGADRRALQPNRYFGERLPGEPAGGRARPGPGEGGERGLGGGVETGCEAVGVGQQSGGLLQTRAVGGAGQPAGGAVDGQRDEQGVGQGAFGPGERGDGPQEMASAPVHEEVGQPGRMGVEHLPRAVPDEVVGAARGQPAAVAFGDDERRRRFVGERAALQGGVRQGLLARGDDDVVQPRVGRDGAGAFQLVLVALGGEVVERDGEQPLPRARAVAEDGAGQPRQSGGQQREGGGRAAPGEVRTDTGHRCPPGRAAVGGPHPRDRPGVGRQGGRGVPGGGEPGPHGVDQRVPDAFDRAHRVGLGCGDGERGHRLVTGDLPRPLTEDQRVARRDPLHALVRGAVAQRLGRLGAGEQGGQVADVELGLDEVGEGEGSGGVRGAVGPGGVEDGPGPGEVACDGDAAADLDDGRVTARPGGEMAQGPAPGGEQAHPQLFVGGAATAQYREAGGGGALRTRGRDDPHLVGAPVADGPQRVRVAPQELGAHRLDRAPLVPAADRAHGAEARGDTAPPHQPTHRRLHRLWTNRRTRTRGTPLRDMLPRQRRRGGGTGGAHRMRMRPWQTPGCGPPAHR